MVRNYEVAAVAAIKWFRHLIESYKGPEDRLREWLLAQLTEYEGRGDEALARLMEEIL
ncbi:MAG: hypothetical protein QXL32_05430 [Candidatus Bathyarchaeia archaeon]